MGEGPGPTSWEMHPLCLCTCGPRRGRGEAQGCLQRKRGSHLCLAPCSLGHSPDPPSPSGRWRPSAQNPTQDGRAILQLGRTRSLSHQEEALAGPGV